MAYNNQLAKFKDVLRGKVLIVGIGNPLRADDGVGPEIIRRLRGRLPSSLLFDVGEVPENYLEKLVKENPDTIVLIDAVQFDSKPGTVRIIEKDNITNESLSTHRISLSMVKDYLEKETCADIFLLGIQPETIKLGKGISEPVRKSLEKIVDMIERLNVFI